MRPLISLPVVAGISQTSCYAQSFAYGYIVHKALRGIAAAWHVLTWISRLIVRFITSFLCLHSLPGSKGRAPGGSSEYRSGNKD